MARSLSAHPLITIAADPYFQFFKSFRNEIYSQNIDGFDHNSPVSDNFWSEKIDLDKIILDSSFDTNFNNTSLEEIIAQIEDSAGTYAEKLLPILPSVKASNYKDLFSELISLIYKAYGKNEAKFVGFKCTFAELFIAPTIKTFPKSKIICVVRDPRAIYASQIVPKKNYPLLYIIRQWRKSIEYILQNISEENVLVVRYEDLVDNTEQTMKSLSKFIGIHYHSDMINPSKYTDGAGKPWTQNSSYNNIMKKNVINDKNKDRWRSVLTDNEIQLIEDFCDTEMKIFGYQRFTDNNMVNLQKKYNEDKNDFLAWFKEFFYQYEITELEISKEIIRHLYLKNNLSDNYISNKLLVSATEKYKNKSLFK